MDRSRLTGTILMVAMAAQVVLFLIGAARRSYAALAIPIALMVTFLSVLGFWVGWTLASMEDDLTGLEFEAEPLDEN
jgi:mannose/fructose/N-acetylgalactosamine-specific phosphotransferase system component IIC